MSGGPRLDAPSCPCRLRPVDRMRRSAADGLQPFTRSETALVAAFVGGLEMPNALPAPSGAAVA